MERGDVSFDGVRHGVHARMRGELGRHGLGERGIDDRHVGSDIEVRKRIFDALLIIRNDGESRDFGRRSGSGRNGAELGFGAQRGERERLDYLLEGSFGIFIEHPHCLRRVDRRTATHGDYPIRLEFAHYRRALHHRFHGRIGLDVFDEFDVHAGFVEIGDRLVDKTESFHAAAAQNEHGAFTFKVREFFKRPFAVIKIAGQSKTSHKLPPFVIFLSKIIYHFCGKISIVREKLFMIFT